MGSRSHSRLGTASARRPVIPSAHATARHAGALACLLLAACGCSGDHESENPGPTAVAADDARAFEALKHKADDAQSLDAEGALEAYAVRHLSSLSYDPLESARFDLIQASAVALSTGELDALSRNGFVVSTRQEFPTFTHGIALVYAEHLPLYVTADSLLEAVHRSYDTILFELERGLLIDDVRTLLGSMREALPGVPASESVRTDTDLYLAVALSLLDGDPATPVAGATQERIDELVELTTTATGMTPIELFGISRSVDTSQFTPRGHYAGDPVMEQYFRAMIWLGRIDLRLIETEPNGAEVFRRDQYEAMLLLRDLIGDEAMRRWDRVDTAIRTFVGESDYMVVPEVDALVRDLGGPEQALSASDDAVVAAIVRGGYGKQEIASHLMVNATAERLPLHRSFLVFGQRYVADSHVFSEVVYDRIPRLMPNPLDAAFAALGNDQALALEQPELETVDELAGALARMRVLIDSHDDDFWQANFYNLWSWSLRALSPPSDSSDPAALGLPEVAGTEAWGRRMLNAQLGSWAELRHDTLLYAKQSYTGIPICEFPDVYVDPYPAFYDALRTYAERGDRIVEIATELPDEDLAARIASHFEALRNVAIILGDMARRQRDGQAFTDDQLAFIERIVRVETEGGCAPIEVADGWYADLFLDRGDTVEFDPTIADVHTQPADWDGTIVGKILHVGTGYPRLMVTTVDTCTGPRAYVGVAYAYHEHVTRDFERLTDQEWATRFTNDGERPADVAWMAPVLAE